MGVSSSRCTARFSGRAPVDGVISGIGEPVGGPIAQAELQLALSQSPAQTFHLEGDDLAQFLPP